MRLSIALAQVNPTVGDVPGNAALVRRARERRRRARRRPRGLFRAGARRLSAGGPGAAPRASCRRRPPRFASCSRKAPRAVRASSSPCRGRRTGTSTMPWRSWPTAASICASSTTCRTTACSTRSACSRPARCRSRLIFRGVRLGLPICEDVWYPDCVAHLAAAGRAAAARAERLAVRGREVSPAARPGAPARLRIGAAARLRQPGRRPGRAGVRRRLVRR